jgi:hypothetical protein
MISEIQSKKPSVNHLLPRVGFAAALASAFCIACGDVDAGSGIEEDVGSQSAPITGGRLLDTHVAPWGSAVKIGGCSGLKVSARWYLSAWHCRFDLIVGQPVTVTSGFSGQGGTTHTISEGVIHPTTIQLSGNGYGYDLVMVKLDGDNAIPSWAPLYVHQSDGPGTFVGYGCDEVGTNDGKKQFAGVNTVAYWNSNATAYAFTSNSLNPRICPGDSGGPFFRIFDNQYRLSGVNSTYGAGQGGSDFARVYPASDWIEAVRSGLSGKNDFSNANEGTFLSSSSNYCFGSAGLGIPSNLQQCEMKASSANRFSVQVSGADLKFVNSFARGCLAILGASTADGARVTTRACDNHDTTRWQVVQGFGNYRQIRNKHSGKCIRVEGNGPGSRVSQSTCQSTSDFFWLFSD